MKKIILIRGPICSGKSTVARLLFERNNNSSLIDEDVLKRTIERTKTPKWRSSLAFETALFLTEKLMRRKRTIIADVHSSKKDRYIKYKKLADKYNYTLHSFLLYPPLNTCIERNKLRDIPDVAYKISRKSIEKYWRVLHKVAGEQVFSDSKIEPALIANKILNKFPKTSVG
ncbi:MAG: AAA family ATPase [Patescibacteria group bacterium]